jgi:hypothetical protein
VNDPIRPLALRNAAHDGRVLFGIVRMHGPPAPTR